MADFVGDKLAEAAAQQEQERQIKLAAAWEHYYGTNELPLSIGEDGVDDNVRLNYGRLIVNKGVSWLFGADRTLDFAVSDDGRADEGAEILLDEVWPMESRAGALHQLGVNGGVCGHTFARIIPETDDSALRVVVLDPSNMFVLWNQEDIERVLEYRYTWNAIDPMTADPYVRRQRTIRDGATWRIVDEVSRDGSNTFATIAEELWPYEWCPIFDCQNLPAPNEFYGAADLEPDVLDLVEALEVVGGYARKLVRHKGHPLPYVIGEKSDRMAELNLAIGRLLVIPESTASVGQLQSADLGATLDLYSTLKNALLEMARLPATAFGTSMSNIAEETVELSFAPAVEKTWDKRVAYGPMLSDLAGRILEVSGLPGRSPSPQWTPVVPRSAKSEATALEADIRMGLVSKATAARKRGYDWDEESARIQDERDQSSVDLARVFNAGTMETLDNGAA